MQFIQSKIFKKSVPLLTLSFFALADFSFALSPHSTLNNPNFKEVFQIKTEGETSSTNFKLTKENDIQIDGTPSIHKLVRESLESSWGFKIKKTNMSISEDTASGEGDFRITKVDKGGIGKAANLEEDDILLAVNGIATWGKTIKGINKLLTDKKKVNLIIQKNKQNPLAKHSQEEASRAQETDKLLDKIMKRESHTIETEVKQLRKNLKHQAKNQNQETRRHHISRGIFQIFKKSPAIEPSSPKTYKHSLEADAYLEKEHSSFPIIPRSSLKRIAQIITEEIDSDIKELRKNLKHQAKNQNPETKLHNLIRGIFQLFKEVSHSIEPRSPKTYKYRLEADAYLEKEHSSSRIIPRSTLKGIAQTIKTEKEIKPISQEEKELEIMLFELNEILEMEEAKTLPTQIETVPKQRGVKPFDNDPVEDIIDKVEDIIDKVEDIRVNQTNYPLQDIIDEIIQIEFDRDVNPEESWEFESSKAYNPVPNPNQKELPVQNQDLAANFKSELNNLQESTTAMLIENPDRNKALHVALQRNSRAHRIALQQEFTDKDIPYYSEHVYMSKTLSSIGETIVLDIPQVGQRAVPFIANLKNKNLPIFEELLMNYELERARIRNDYIVNHSSDYKSFLKHLADQHPDSNIRPEVLYQALSWKVALSPLRKEELETLANKELPHLFKTIVSDIEEISPADLNILLESAGLDKALQSDNQRSIKKLLDQREKLIQELAQQAIKIIKENTDKADATFADAYAQLEKIGKQRDVDAFFEDQATKISA